MQIKELKKKGLEREFKILVPSKDVTEKLNVSLLEISKDVEIEGFRKGKVPLDIVKQRFGQNALNKTLDELIQTTSNEVIKKNNLRLALKPKVDVKNDKVAAKDKSKTLQELDREKLEKKFSKEGKGKLN